MKKYCSLMIALVAALFMSCSNDEIKISKTVNFTVNPSTVANKFAAGEIHAGDMESFNTDCKLFVELFVYDRQGNLVEKRSENFSNYAVQMKTSMFLDQGEYTAVAITHVDDVVDNYNYWIIENEETLEGLRVVDGGYIGGENKVLGVSTYEFTVSGSTEDININVEPAGSLLTVEYFNIKALSSYDIVEYRLVGNKTMEYLEFDRSGYTNVVADNHNGSYDWIYDKLTLSYYESGSYTNIYSYEFTLPMTNVGLQFWAYDSSSTYVNLGGTTLETRAGNCYYAFLRLSSNVSNITTEFGQYTTSRSAGNNENRAMAKMAYRKGEKGSFLAGQTLRIKDMLK